MNRQMIVRAAMTGAVAVIVGGVIWLVAGGWVGPDAGARRLVWSADRQAAKHDFAAAQASLESLLARYPASGWRDDALLKLGELQEAQNNLTGARQAYRMLVEEHSDSPLVGQAQAKLGQVNVALLCSSAPSDLNEAYEVKPGDTLGRIAKTYRTTAELIKKKNGLTTDTIRPQQKLHLPKVRLSIVVDKSLNQLLLTTDNQFFKIYPVATGQNNSTPVGTFHVTTRVANPPWYSPQGMIPYGDPRNILGTRWMGFDKPGYGIHGTTDPGAIGQQVTAGCVRMINTDVEELFALVPIGTEVTIVD